MVRWGKDRVCVEALDVAVLEARRRGQAARSWSLIARWSGAKDRGAALSTSDLRQELVCRVEAPDPR